MTWRLVMYVLGSPTGWGIDNVDPDVRRVEGHGCNLPFAEMDYIKSKRVMKESGSG